MKNTDKEIDALYKILVLYEDLTNEKSSITIESYLSYIDRLYVKWLGANRDDIYDTLKGLWELGIEAGHQRVKANVFHMINILERGK